LPPTRLDCKIRFSTNSTDRPMVFRIEIRCRQDITDPHAQGVLLQVRELGIDNVTEVRSARLFFLYGPLNEVQVRRIAQELLTDPVSETYSLAGGGLEDRADQPGQAVIEVHLKPGVMDPVAASTEQAIRDMGLEIHQVRTARRYELSALGDGGLKETIARRLLANAVIEDVYYHSYTPPALGEHRYELKVVEVPITELDDEGLLELSRRGHLFLNLSEMQAIREHYRRLGRQPRDVEIETLAQTWSEHCVHKTFRSDVRVMDSTGKVVEEIPNLIKSTIFRATEQLAKPWCISVFCDNAGVIEFDDRHAVCFKVETHNHPSAIEPYGGASTGVGGVVRDPMGTGLGARPIANTDVFCFGPADFPAQSLPKGVLHPLRVMRGVVAGVRDYGNRMGIPTVNGAVYFDEKYLGNPLVFCGTAGILDRDKCFGLARSGDAIILVGGRTGRDGIHGATFSSGELTHEHETEFSHAVQIGNAITEKKMLETLVQARDEGLYNAVTDCGAGGLSSAVGEMGAQLGAEVHLDRVPLKYAGLNYTEIWISEAQERMVIAVSPQNVERALKVFSAEDVQATVVGHFGTEDRQLRLIYNGTLVGELSMEFLHDGIPRPVKDALIDFKLTPSPVPPKRESYGEILLKILASPNVASKEWIIRQYDHEVQGGSAIKPLVGAKMDGPGDAAVVRPVLDSHRAVVLSCGMNPRLGELDAYQSALHAVDEALRNAVAVGADLDRTAILDNFCWGNCNKPDRMGSLVQAAKACYEAAVAYGTPFISGKDSLNNEFQTEDGRTISIPPTLLISAISVIADARRCVTADAKQAGNYVFLLGRTDGRLGGSHYLLVEGLPSGTDVPPVDLKTNLAVMRTIQRAIEAGFVRACHDLSEGGLAAAAAEMSFAGDLGMELDIESMRVTQQSADQAKLFAESAGRFLAEVAPKDYDAFCRLIRDVPFAEIGKITDTDKLVIKSRGNTLIDLPIDQAKSAWQGTFRM